MKQSQLRLENNARMLSCGGLCFVGLLAPRPPATWDVASQIAPYGAGKKQRKENILLRLFTKNMRKFYAHKGITWD